MLHIPVPQLQNHGSDELIRGVLDESLTAGYPVAGGLCANYLNDTSYSGLGSNRATQQTRLTSAPRDCAKHSIIISGRAPMGRGGKCMYLVRNSWGPGWRGPDADRLIARRRTPCACKLRTSQGRIEYQENCSSTPDSQVVERLGCWFDADEFMHQLGEVVTYHRPARR